MARRVLSRLIPLAHAAALSTSPTSPTSPLALLEREGDDLPARMRLALQFRTAQKRGLREELEAMLEALRLPANEAT